MADWKTRLAVLGAAAGCLVAAKVLRRVLLAAEINLLPPPVKQFKGEWALVTGASEGVGRAIAAALAGYGVNVVMVSRSKTKLDAAANEITQKHKGVWVQTIATDLAQPSNVQQLLQQLLSDPATPISLLVANAGGSLPALRCYWEFTEEEETAMRNLNGQACYILVKGLLPGMLQRGKGAVVAISSMMPKMGGYAIPYGSEKAKINSMCEALDAELHGSGVTAQSMVLGAVLTLGLLSFMHPTQAAAATTGSSITDSTSGTGSTTGSTTRSTPGSTSAAATAKVKPSFFMPSADVVAASIVRCIGRGGPVITPHFAHAVLSDLLLDNLWPPALYRAVARGMSRYNLSSWQQRVAAARQPSDRAMQQL